MTALSAPYGRQAFLPAPQSFMEQSASRASKVLLLAISGFLLAAFAWSALAPVERHVRASGVLEPDGQVKTVNHDAGGRVVEMAVGEGETVEIGQILLRFDTTEAQSAVNALRGEIEVNRATLARLQAELDGTDLTFPADLAEARPDLFEAQMALLDAARQARSDQSNAQTSTGQRRQSEIRALEAEALRLQGSLNLVNEQLTAVRDLADKGLYPRLKVVMVERQANDLRGELATTRERLNTARAAADETANVTASDNSAERRDLLAQIAATQAELSRLEEVMIEREAALFALTVRAPASGIVQDLAVNAAGQAVAANQTLLKIVPVDQRLVVTASIDEADIARVQPGQEVTVKLNAYDYLRYGSLSGVVERIDADAAVDDRQQRRYGVRIGLQQPQEGEPTAALRLQPGMAAEVALHGGTHTVLAYLTERLFRAADDAFREG